MVVIKNYSENFLKSDSNFEREPEIDEDRAYVVGIWVVVIVAALLLLLLAVIASGRSKNNEELAKKDTSQSQNVLGEKQKSSTPSSKESTTAEVKTQAGSTQGSTDVTTLERPLTEAETLEKAKTIPGSKIHTVEVGESLYTIGEKYKVDWKKIAEVNNLAEPYSLHTGQKLIITAAD